MLIDNKTASRPNLKSVFDFIKRYVTKSGTFQIVTGYFSASGLARLQSNFNPLVTRYEMVIGDLAKAGEEKDKMYNLLSDNLSLQNGVNTYSETSDAIKFLEQDKVHVKTMKPNFCHAKAYVFTEENEDPKESFYVVGSSNLTEAGLGIKQSSNIELNTADFGASSDYAEVKRWFSNLWNNPVAKDYVATDVGTRIPFKKYLIDLLQDWHKKYTPEELYYKVLYELFKKDLLSFEGDPEFNRQFGGLSNTDIWRSLYPFQRNGVISLIKTLQRYDGAILADAVGLGKTWEALAVIKFYELKGFQTFLFCPKKLEKNWRQYLKNHNSLFENDRLDFVIRYHTDLQDDRINRHQDGLRLNEHFQSDKPKLIVIDESHNLRNDASQRYQFLLDNILKKNPEIKVLLLSATPINTSLKDIKNQFKLFVKGDNRGFSESLGIQNVDRLFNEANKEFKLWVDQSDETLEHLVRRLEANFFRFTDALVIARTRKLIEGKANNLQFPHKTKPSNHFITPSHIGNIKNFDQLFNLFPPQLAGYKPSLYIVPPKEKKEAIFDEQIQDRYLVKMMYILLLKRLESSWRAFYETIKKVNAHHQFAYEKAIAFKEKYDAKLSQLEISLEGLSTQEETEIGSVTLGKRQIRLLDIHQSGRLEEFISDLKADLKAMTELLENLEIMERQVTAEQEMQSHDTKLAKLISIIQEKAQSTKNASNKKLIVFTAFRDTAVYLYNELLKRGFDKISCVTGDESYVWDSDQSHKDFEPILQRFAPYTKLYKERRWDGFTSKELGSFEEWKMFASQKFEHVRDLLERPIDILIATDCLSEGQNLQDADLVVNYDIHWNPVRIIQRMGRIDRLGSPNLKDGISGTNFWPSEDVDGYINLREKVENRIAAMRLAGAEVDENFSERVKARLENETLERKQEEKMLRQMEGSLNEVEEQKAFSFSDLSLELFRQELTQLFMNRQNELKRIPNGVFTGFKPKPDQLIKEIPGGMIALVGYPQKSAGATDHEYSELHLLYMTPKGESQYVNAKEILTVLQSQKTRPRHVSPGVEKGKKEDLEPYNKMLLNWIDIKAGRTGSQEVLDILNSGRMKRDDPEKKTNDMKFQPENFDLIAWFAISE
ncbi:MAG: DEAD/DEAH box helicase family protein [Cyclobacteriaceae bacterium]|nr:DEAD/DEAH box helicase family protein [Cyclobacteriaceae bacterium]